MTEFFWGLLVYMLIINVIQFLLFAYDKSIAGKVMQRIPEIWFWRVALVGGAFGAWVAMEIFRHKTQHRKFASGMPWLAIIQLSTLCFFIGRYLS